MGADSQSAKRFTPRHEIGEGYLAQRLVREAQERGNVILVGAAGAVGLAGKPERDRRVVLFACAGISSGAAASW